MSAPAGTARLQLVHKGDFNYTYTDLANILPMGGILSIGIIAWLLDKKASCSGVYRRNAETSISAKLGLCTLSDALHHRTANRLSTASCCVVFSS